MPTEALDPTRSIAQYSRSVWGLDDGLPHGTVRALVRQADGYLWLATYDGLVRFDGRRFDVFDGASTPAIHNPTVHALWIAPDGTFWIGTNDGLSRWRHGRHGIESSRAPIDVDVFDLVGDAEGGLWVATAGQGLVRLDGEREQRWTTADGLPDDTVTDLALDASGGLWVGTASGAARWAGDRWVPVAGLESESVRAILPETDGVLFGTERGVWRLPFPGQAAGQVEPELVVAAGEQVTSLLRDRDGALWVGTYARGLVRLDTSGRVERFGIDAGLPDPSVRSMLEDEDGALWVGTNAGLVRLDTGAMVPWGIHEGLPDDYVRAVLPTDDGLWVGTAAGLARLDPSRGVIEALDAIPELSDPYVLSFAESRRGGLWIGTTSGLVHRSAGAVAAGSDEVTAWTVADGLPHGVVRAIVDPATGPVWIGTDAGLAGLDLVAGTISRHPAFRSRASVVALASDPEGRLWAATDGDGLWVVSAGTAQRIEGLPTPHVLAISVDARGRVWAGTDGAGLARVDGAGATPRLLNTAHGLPFDKITTILDDDLGGLWLGSSRGLARLDRDQVWAASAGETTLLAVRRFGRPDGLRTLQLNGITQPNAARDSTGRLWFATARGVVSTDPSALYGQPEPPPTVIDEVILDGAPVPPDRSSTTIPILPGTRWISIRWVSFAFDAPAEVRSRYRLLPRSPAWIETEAASLTFEPPTPGTYRFEVAASLDGRHWRDGAHVILEVQPRWWQRPWVRVGFALALWAIVWGGHRVRMRALRVRARELEERVRERTVKLRRETLRAEAALADARRHEHEAEAARQRAEEANRAKSDFLALTSHELRTPLTAILGYTSLLLGSVEEERPRRYVDSIRRSGDDLLQQINNLLDLSKIQARQMTLDLDTVAVPELVQRVAEQLQGLVLHAGLALDIVDRSADAIRADGSKIQQVVLNLLSNAIKFSPAGTTITITLEATGNDLTAEGAGDPAWRSPAGSRGIWIRVADQGKGVPEEERLRIFEPFQQARDGRTQRGTGLGLAIVRHFTSMHGGEVRLVSEPGRGAEFGIWLPAGGPSAAEIDCDGG